VVPFDPTCQAEEHVYCDFAEPATKVQRRRAKFENARQRFYDLIVEAEAAGDAELAASLTDILNKLADARAKFEADQKGSSRP